MPSGTEPTFFTGSGVRLRRRAARPGALSWLLLPGGPGLGSESLYELADLLRVPGEIWMVDLPGDGSNVDPPGVSGSPFARWPDVLLEAAGALSNVVLVGHSTGGMYCLSVPDLERQLAGLALISTAPDATWMPHFAEMTRQQPLPAVESATKAYESEQTNERLRDVAVASAEWNFTPESVAVGRELLGRMPYNVAAVDWSARNFDETYVARWWPRSLPTLILSGAMDRIVRQSAWERPEFQRSNVIRRVIDDAAHFPWIERPAAVGLAFDELAAQIQDAMTRPST